MDLKLKDKVIIVTGGAKGIGEGIVRALAAEGAIPVVVCRDKEDNEKVVKKIEQNGGKSFGVVAELTKREECEKAIAEVIAG